MKTLVFINLYTVIRKSISYVISFGPIFYEFEITNHIILERFTGQGVLTSCWSYNGLKSYHDEVDNGKFSECFEEWTFFPKNQK